MSAYSQTQKPIADTSSPDARPDVNLDLGWLTNLLSIAALLGAAILLFTYLGLAIDWQNQPFAGALFNHALEVRDVDPISDQEWAALEAGLRPGDQVIYARTLDEIETSEWAEEDRVQ